MIKRVLLCLLTCAVFISPSFGQVLMDYGRFYSQSEFNVTKAEDLVYAKARTNYYLYSGSGAKSEKSSYDLVTQLPLTLDLYNPNTSSKPGKRAVLILIPGGGRTGCLGVSQCSQATTKQSGLYSSDAYYISQEGADYNETADQKARDYSKSGFVVLTLNTRYTYHDKRYEANGTNRWLELNGSASLNSASAHMENLIVDIKRAVRWISHPTRANNYNIDPNNIFIQAGSGGAKMASLAAVTSTDTFLADSPAHTQSGNSQYQFEVNNNNLAVPQKPFRGAILFAGDMHGTKHRTLITQETGALMLWHGTKDRSLLHGIAETIEEKCEEVGCVTEFYSLANVQHGAQGAAKYEHTDRVSNSGGLKTGVRAHLHDFIVNHLDRGSDNRPGLSINASKVKFNESTGRADIEINLSRAVGQPVSFTASADQMREVMLKNARQGQYSYIQSYVATDSQTTGPIAYDQGTGVAFEDVSNVTPKYAGQTYHNGGPGNGQPVLIPASSSYFTNDFQGKKQVLTIPAGQTKATFRVTLFNDSNSEQNECFKVRLLNANGAKITNSVEMITILDDDNPAASTATELVCENPAGNNGGGTPTDDTVRPTISIIAPTLVSDSAITDTSIIIEDNDAIVASKVIIRSDNTAGVTDFNCSQINSKRVDCSLQIIGSGDLKLKAEDQAGNISYKKMDGYDVTAPTGNDTLKSTIVINAPTKTSTSTITDTTIVITDDQAIDADNIFILPDTTVSLANFSCSQTTITRVDCTLDITGSGDLRLKAVDQAGNIAYKQMQGYEITTPTGNDTVKSTIVIEAPTKISTSTITDTTIVVTDDQAIDADKVSILADTTADVSNLSCIQTAIDQVDCTISISSSGDLKIKAVDQAGNIAYKQMQDYEITTPTGNDTVKSTIVINAPTKISASAITDTTIVVTDDQAIDANKVSILGDTTANVSNLSCVQINLRQVDCTIIISSSGDLKIKAEDHAGNITYKQMQDYEITTPTGNDTVKSVIVINAPTRISDSTITDTTIVVTDDKAINANQVSILGDTTANVSGLSCSQTTSKQVNCTINIFSSGDLKLKAVDQAGNITYKQMQDYQVTTTNGGADTIRSMIVINAPTKISASTITDTTIIVTDDQAIDANQVSVLGDTTADVSNLNCIQSSSKRIDCSISISSSGDLKLKAVDQAGNIAYRKMEGYLIN